MNVALAGFTLDVVGKILLAVSILLVHGRIKQEKKIDKHIIKEMEVEKIMVIIGIIFIIFGYLLQLPSKLY